MKKEIIIGVILLCIIHPKIEAAVIVDYQFENNLNDSSGNGFNAVGGTGFGYSSNVPGAVINPGAVPDIASYKQGTVPSTVASNSTINTTFASGSFTLQAFVYLNPGASNFQQIFGDISGSTGIYFAVGTGAGHEGDLHGYNGNNVSITKSVGPTGLTTGTWYSVAWVGTFTANNGTAVQFYLNGVADGTAAFFQQNSGTAISPSSANWDIGGPSNNFNGLIDDLQLDNTALTPAQFNSVAAVPEPSTAGYAVLGMGVMGLCFGMFRNRSTGANQ